MCPNDINTSKTSSKYTYSIAPTMSISTARQGKGRTYHPASKLLKNSQAPQPFATLRHKRDIRQMSNNQKPFESDAASASDLWDLQNPSGILKLETTFRHDIRL
jgi:hypothetical protein